MESHLLVSQHVFSPKLIAYIEQHAHHATPDVSNYAKGRRRVCQATMFDKETSMIAWTGTYCVETWDTELEEYTPQEGVESGPHSWAGLLAALRQLRAIGYECRRPDPFVRVTCEAAGVVDV